jgi:hypothetical protein
MSRIISEKTITARKRHQCDWCRLSICPGEAYNRATTASDGHLYTWKSHPQCDAEVSLIAWEYGDDDYPQGYLADEDEGRSDKWLAWYAARSAKVES